MEPLEELLKKVQSLNKEKKYDEAIDLLPDKILEEYKSADLYAEKARAYHNTKEKELRNKMIDIALSIDANNAKAIYYKGISFEDRKEYDKSIEFYNKAISITPKFSYPYNTLGNVYKMQKQYDKAIQFYNKAIKIDPTDSFPYNGLGNVYTKLKKYDEAIKFYNKAINIESEFPYAYSGLGNVYSNLKKYNEAIKFYNKAINVDPEYGYTYFNRAQIFYHNFQRYEDALLDYKQFIKYADNKNDDYYIQLSKSQIEELEKIIKSSDYSGINELVNKIKDLLSFNDGCITHYTSLSTAKILVIDNGIFRLSEGTFLNDTSEGGELFKFLDYNTTIKKSNDTIATCFTQKPFIGSFVAETKHDDLTLWRMYGKEEKEEAKGCAVTIDMKGFLEKIKTSLSASAFSLMDDEFQFYRVAYRESEQKFVIPGASKKITVSLNKYMTELQKAINEIDQKKTDVKQNVTELLNQIAYLFKSIEYQHENEVRLVLKGVGFEKKFNILPKVYIELVPIRPLIKKITIGPKVERADEWAAAFHYSLDKDNLHPEILISHLPFK